MVTPAEWRAERRAWRRAFRKRNREGSTRSLLAYPYAGPPPRTDAEVRAAEERIEQLREAAFPPEEGVPEGGVAVEETPGEDRTVEGSDFGGFRKVFVARETGVGAESEPQYPPGFDADGAGPSEFPPGFGG